jgi:hypothetical protein
MHHEALSFDEIKTRFPDEWVLIGNPELSDENTLGSVVSKLQRGVLLFHSKDKREIAYKAKEVRQGFERTACVFTGELPKSQRFWL